MHNRPGYTVEPVYEDSATGQQIVDVQVRETANGAVGRDGQYQGWRDDYTSDAYGEPVYDPHIIDELAESPVVGFDEGEYIDALLDSNPLITPALEFAVDYMPQ